MKDSFVTPLVGFAKFALGGLFTLAFRLVTPLIGMPNVTPLMATQFSGAKAYGPWIGGLYGFLSMIALDLVTGNVGYWTISTSICYGLIGIVAGYMFKGRSPSTKDFLVASVAGTLFFDLVTGVLMAPLAGTSIQVAFVGQIPFTAYHLVGNLFFALFSRIFYEKIMGNPALEIKLIFKDAYVPH